MMLATFAEIVDEKPRKNEEETPAGQGDNDSFGFGLRA